MDDDIEGFWQGRKAEWHLAWLRLHTLAIVFCRRLAENDAVADVLADHAFQRMHDELNARVRTGRLVWKGKKAFFSYAYRRLIWRCRDGLRSARLVRHVSVDDSRIAGRPLIQMTGERRRAARGEGMKHRHRAVDPAEHDPLSDLVVLAELRASCPPKCQVLLSFIEALEAYRRSVPAPRGAERSAFVMAALNIGRVAFDQRLRRVRKLGRIAPAWPTRGRKRKPGGGPQPETTQANLRPRLVRRRPHVA